MPSRQTFKNTAAVSLTEENQFKNQKQVTPDSLVFCNILIVVFKLIRYIFKKVFMNFLHLPLGGCVPPVCEPVTYLGFNNLYLNQPVCLNVLASWI